VGFPSTVTSPLDQEGFPLSRKAPQPEPATQPPAAQKLHPQQAPHELQPLNTDRWYYRVFQSAPDLIRALLPGSGAAANALEIS